MKRIEKEIRKGKEEGRKVFVMGDFNAKVDREVDEGKIKSKGGKEVAETNGMIFINEMKVTEGKWTRVENGKKSVLDYMMVEKEEEDSVKKMIIDEDRKYTPYRIVADGAETRDIYTDHNAMICNMEWKIEAEYSSESNNRKRIITTKGYQKFKEILAQEEVSKILKDEEKTIQERYDMWKEKVFKILEQCRTKIKKKKEHNLAIRILMKAKRRIKKQRVQKKSDKRRRKLINSHIIKERQRKYSRRIKEAIQELRRN